jgi:hypothetical protein
MQDHGSMKAVLDLELGRCWRHLVLARTAAGNCNEVGLEMDLAEMADHILRSQEQLLGGGARPARYGAKPQGRLRR